MWSSHYHPFSCNRAIVLETGSVASTPNAFGMSVEIRASNKASWPSLRCLCTVLSTSPNARAARRRSTGLMFHGSDTFKVCPSDRDSSARWYAVGLRSSAQGQHAAGGPASRLAREGLEYRERPGRGRPRSPPLLHTKNLFAKMSRQGLPPRPRDKSVQSPK